MLAIDTEIVGGLLGGLLSKRERDQPSLFRCVLCDATKELWVRSPLVDCTPQLVDRTSDQYPQRLRRHLGKVLDQVLDLSNRLVKGVHAYLPLQVRQSARTRH